MRAVGLFAVPAAAGLVAHRRREALALTSFATSAAARGVSSELPLHTEPAS